MQLKKVQITNIWSIESINFINRLLQRKLYNKIGLRKPIEAKEFSWFKNIDWTNLYFWNLKEPFIPKKILIINI